MKTIKVIDLLNMIANKEYDRLPLIVEYEFQRFYLETQILKAEGVAVVKDCNYQNSMGSCIMNYLNSESYLNRELEIIQEQILDEKEKEYLSYVIRPFRDKVNYVTKRSQYKIAKEWITISVGDDESIMLPYFRENTMYKGMKSSKEYTLEELGL